MGRTATTAGAPTTVRSAGRGASGPQGAQTWVVSGGGCTITGSEEWSMCLVG